MQVSAPDGEAVVLLWPEAGRKPVAAEVGRGQQKQQQPLAIRCGHGERRGRGSDGHGAAAAFAAKASHAAHGLQRRREPAHFGTDGQPVMGAQMARLIEQAINAGPLTVVAGDAEAGFFVVQIPGAEDLVWGLAVQHLPQISAG